MHCEHAHSQTLSKCPLTMKIFLCDRDNASLTNPYNTLLQTILSTPTLTPPSSTSPFHFPLPLPSSTSHFHSLFQSPTMDNSPALNSYQNSPVQSTLFPTASPVQTTLFPVQTQLFPGAADKW